MRLRGVDFFSCKNGFVRLNIVQLCYRITWSYHLDTQRGILKQIGKNIKNIRIKRGMTQLDLAAECGFEKSTLGRIKIGVTNPTVKTLAKIARALEVNLTDLVKMK